MYSRVRLSKVILSQQASVNSCQFSHKLGLQQVCEAIFERMGFMLTLKTILLSVTYAVNIYTSKCGKSSRYAIRCNIYVSLQ